MLAELSILAFVRDVYPVSFISALLISLGVTIGYIVHAPALKTKKEYRKHLEFRLKRSH